MCPRPLYGPSTALEILWVADITIRPSLPCSLFLFADISLPVPVSRGNLYLVAEGPMGVFRFYGAIFWEDFERLYPGGSAKITKGSATEAIVAVASFVFAIVLVAVIFGGLPALFRGR